MPLTATHCADAWRSRMQPRFTTTRVSAGRGERCTTVSGSVDGVFAVIEGLLARVTWTWSSSPTPTDMSIGGPKLTPQNDVPNLHMSRLSLFSMHTYYSCLSISYTRTCLCPSPLLVDSRPPTPEPPNVYALLAACRVGRNRKLSVLAALPTSATICFLHNILVLESRALSNIEASSKRRCPRTLGIKIREGNCFGRIPTTKFWDTANQENTLAHILKRSADFEDGRGFA